ncbi:MAPEG family protein [Sulfitobacter sp. F26204]|uniref:MAPEG family protein n=1 Tax=Sulfitobacter sp. F26204 TaxID=2996014 RepID=UPI00225E5C55|nr:MAPEG family protein [Sulfitobacter sp. F26204]MCX7559426.1 MAPEG family protein [Sulfitobacter sp. F26204]
MMDYLEAYSHAIAALAIWALLSLVLGAMSTLGRNAQNRCECGLPRRDYSDVVYRRGRAFANAMEMNGPFVAATVAGILAGAAPFWVNILASVFILSRVAMAVVHIGTENQPLRSMTWAIGMLCVFILALMAAIAAF